MRKLVVLLTATGSQGQYDAYWLCYWCQEANELGYHCEVDTKRKRYLCGRCRTEVLVDWERIRKGDRPSWRWYSPNDIIRFVEPVSHRVRRKYECSIKAFEAEQPFGVDEVHGLFAWVGDPLDQVEADTARRTLGA